MPIFIIGDNAVSIGRCGSSLVRGLSLYEQALILGSGDNAPMIRRYLFFAPLGLVVLVLLAVVFLLAEPDAKTPSAHRWAASLPPTPIPAVEGFTPTKPGSGKPLMFRDGHIIYLPDDVNHYATVTACDDDCPPYPIYKLERQGATISVDGNDERVIRDVVTDDPAAFAFMFQPEFIRSQPGERELRFRDGSIIRLPLDVVLVGMGSWGLWDFPTRAHWEANAALKYPEESLGTFSTYRLQRGQYYAETDIVRPRLLQRGSFDGPNYRASAFSFLTSSGDCFSPSLAGERELRFRDGSTFALLPDVELVLTEVEMVPARAAAAENADGTRFVYYLENGEYVVAVDSFKDVESVTTEEFAGIPIDEPVPPPRRAIFATYHMMSATSQAPFAFHPTRPGERELRFRDGSAVDLPLDVKLVGYGVISVKLSEEGIKRNAALQFPHSGTFIVYYLQKGRYTTRISSVAPSHIGYNREPTDKASEFSFLLFRPSEAGDRELRFRDGSIVQLPSQVRLTIVEASWLYDWAELSRWIGPSVSEDEARDRVAALKYPPDPFVIRIYHLQKGEHSMRVSILDPLDNNMYRSPPIDEDHEFSFLLFRPSRVGERQLRFRNGPAVPLPPDVDLVATWEWNGPFPGGPGLDETVIDLMTNSGPPVYHLRKGQYTAWVDSFQYASSENIDEFPFLTGHPQD